MERYTVNCQGKVIEFDLHRKNVKNINLNIKPDMSIMVSANPKVPLDFVMDYVIGKAPWIIKNIVYFKDVQPEYKSHKEYVSGESFKYLGKQYRLKVEESEEGAVKYLGGYIYLYIKDKNDVKRKEQLIEKWFREKAEINFRAALDRVYPVLEKYDIKKPQIMIRSMKARWGSCIKDKNIIILNYELIKAPKFCIDYVVLHELIHFKYRNHDGKFTNFLTVLMPDWKMRKEILDEEVVRGL
jgi:hypothetical protein